MLESLNHLKFCYPVKNRNNGVIERVKYGGATDKMNGVWVLCGIHFARDWFEFVHTDTGKLADSLIRGTQGIYLIQGQ